MNLGFKKSNPSAIPVKMVNVLRLLSLVSVPILAYMPSVTTKINICVLHF